MLAYAAATRRKEVFLVTPGFELQVGAAARKETMNASAAFSAVSVDLVSGRVLLAHA